MATGPISISFASLRLCVKVEAMHLAVLRNALGENPVPAAFVA